MLYVYRFGGEDSHGGVAVKAIVEIRLCDCNGHGDCEYSDVLDAVVDAEQFVIVQCNCASPYDGKAIIYNQFKYFDINCIGMMIDGMVHLRTTISKRSLNCCQLHT